MYNPKYYQKNKERYKEYRRRFKSKNPNYQKEYYNKNKKRWKKYRLKYIKTRQMIIIKLGGKCMRCGYSEFESSLDIHHKKENNNKKWKRQYYSTLKNINFNKLLILCSNCHKALHHRKWKIEDIKMMK